MVILAVSIVTMQHFDGNIYFLGNCNEDVVAMAYLGCEGRRFLDLHGCHGNCLG